MELSRALSFADSATGISETSETKLESPSTSTAEPIRKSKGMANTPTQAEPKDLLSPLPLWDQSLSLRVGGGYRDNVLLSPASPVGNALVSSGLDYSAWRLPIDGPEVTFFFSGEDTRFLDTPEARKEQLFLTLLSIKRETPGGWKWGLGLQYFYQDQILDASSTETEFVTVQAVGHHVGFTPSLRKELGPNWRLLLEFDGARQFFEEPLDGYWQAGPKFTLERPYGHGSELAASLEWRRRNYDTRTVTDRDGVPLGMSRLEFDQRDVRLQWQHVWDQASHWRTTCRLGWEENRDNGAHFYDYQRPYAALGIRFRSKEWELKVQGRYSHADYPLQTVSATDLRQRSRDAFQFTGRVERKLGSHLKIYAEYEREESSATTFYDQYRVTTASGGMEWEF